MTSTEGALSPEALASFAASFAAKPQRRALRNAVAQAGLRAAALSRDALRRGQFVFSDEIKTGKITNQKHSGRCWLFAGLNVMRHAVAAQYNLDDFELSQTYLMFWDKLEKANYFYENVVATAAEDVGDRVVVWLLTKPLQDGGQWDMFADLVAKYGVVPKGEMPEAFGSGESAAMNAVLTAKVRRDALTLREAARAGEGGAALRARKAAMLEEVYRMLAISLGEPPAAFDLEWRDKDGNFTRAPGITPPDFLNRYVPLDVSEYVSVINAPTADKPFGRTYTVQYLGNVVGGRSVLYLNVDAETFAALAAGQVAAGEPTWFGCDMSKMVDAERGLMDAALYDYAGALDTPLAFTKGERLDYRESCLTHAMVLAGVNLVDGRAERWKVENSWGDERGRKGFFVMDRGWFDEYTYQAVIRKSRLSPEHLRALEEPPVVLPPWDPMGTLAG